MKKKKIIVFELTDDGTCGHIISLKEALEKYKENFSINLESKSWCFKEEFKMIGETILTGDPDGIIGVYNCTKIEQLNRILNWNKNMSKVKA